MILTEEIVVDSWVHDKRVVGKMKLFYFPIFLRQLALRYASFLDILENSDLLVFRKTKKHNHTVGKEHGLGHVRVVDRRLCF